MLGPIESRSRFGEPRGGRIKTAYGGFAPAGFALKRSLLIAGAIGRTTVGGAHPPLGTPK